MATFAPQIEIELPSGDILEMTEEEFNTFRSKKIDLGAIFASAPEDKTNYLREEDVQAFLDWTAVTQEKENRPIGANTTQGQARIDKVIGVTDTSLPPEARSFLNAIAEIEGGTYTNRYGGGEIPDPNQHPMSTVTVDDVPSSASGRYQINMGTWSDIIKANKDITDFSPVNQDKAAWWLAQKRYKSNTTNKENPEGRDLLSDLQAGNTDLIKPALEKTWAALQVKPFRYEQPSPDAQTPPIGSSNVEYDIQGKIRSQTLSPTLEASIGNAVGQVFGPGYKARIYSGGQESNAPGEGTGSIRHNAGMAGDVYVVGPDGNVLQDTTQLDKLKNFWLQNNLGSVGTYMKGGGLHLDEWTQDKLLPGMGLTWSYGNG
jgi:muramidase (phage lysozyme)